MSCQTHDRCQFHYMIFLLLETDKSPKTEKYCKLGFYFVNLNLWSSKMTLIEKNSMFISGDQLSKFCACRKSFLKYYVSPITFTVPFREEMIKITSMKKTVTLVTSLHTKCDVAT